MTIDTGNILLIGSILLFISILAGKAGYRFGVPMLLLFLGVGMFFGSDGLGIQFNNSAAAQFIGMMALSIILFSGGMDTKYSEIKPIAGPGIMLATIGVLLAHRNLYLLHIGSSNRYPEFIVYRIAASRCGHVFD